LREEDGTAVGGTDTEHAGWRSQTRNASIAKPGKVGRWRAGKRGNEPSFASDGQRGEAAAVRGIKTDGSRGGPTEAATELLPPTRSALAPPEISPLVSALLFLFLCSVIPHLFFLFPPRPAGGAACFGESEVSPSGSVVVAPSFAPAEFNGRASPRDTCFFIRGVGCRDRFAFSPAAL
jgi:hypothetical protein